MNTEIFSPFPATLKKIGLFSPSARPDPERLPLALKLIRSLGIECVCPPHLLAAGEEDYFGADDSKRAEDFNFLLRAPDIQLILCTRGGYGSAYLFDKIDWNILRTRKLPVCGYSDVTAFLLAMQKKYAGIPVAGRMAAHLPGSVRDPFTMHSMKHVLTRALGGKTSCPQKCRLKPVSDTIHPVTGPFLPVNLSVLTSLCGSKHLPSFKGVILALEDIDEIPRKIDRMMLQLELNGFLDQAAGVVFGQFAGECGSAAEKTRIFRRFAKRHPDTAFFTGLPFGHELPSLSFLFGRKASITSGGILTQ